MAKWNALDLDKRGDGGSTIVGRASAACADVFERLCTQGD
jgi:hypothetical protein